MPLPGYLVDDRLVLEGVSRRESKAVFIGEGIVLCRVLGTYFMYADADDLGIAPHFALNGFWESEVTLALARARSTGILVPRRRGKPRLLHPCPRGWSWPRWPCYGCRAESALSRSHDENTRRQRISRSHRVVSRAMSDRHGDTVQFFIPTHRGMNALVGSGGR